jgi:hypothetical protein
VEACYWCQQKMLISIRRFEGPLRQTSWQIRRCTVRSKTWLIRFPTWPRRILSPINIPLTQVSDSLNKKARYRSRYVQNESMLNQAFYRYHKQWFNKWRTIVLKMRTSNSVTTMVDRFTIIKVSPHMFSFACIQSTGFLFEKLKHGASSCWTETDDNEQLSG